MKRNIRTLVSFLLMAAALLNMLPTALGAEDSGTGYVIEMTIGSNTVMVNGEKDDNTLDSPPVIRDGRTLAPLRVVSEQLKYDVYWDASTREVTIKSADRELKLWINQPSAIKTVGGRSETIELDVPPTLINNRTMVPIRFIAECFDCHVGWNASERKVTVATPAWGAERVGTHQMIAYLQGVEKENNGMIIAVMDFGFDLEHPFLVNRFTMPYNAYTNSQGLSNLLPGNHGTHVAGTIAESTPSSVKIMPISIMDSNGHASLQAVIDGVNYAVDNGARVINLSLDTLFTQNFDLDNAINNAINNGCAVVVSAGNNKGNTASYTPASNKNAIVVTAVDINDNFYSECNTGSTVTVSAPGVDIVSSVENDSYKKLSGTSMAAPYVASAAAMLMMDLPDISPQGVKNIIQQYADDRGSSGWDEQYGAGIVNLSRYVQNRTNGFIPDFSESTQEKVDRLEGEIAQLKSDSFQIKTTYIASIISAGMRRYERNSFFDAGYLFERAIVEGDEGATAKNNLAYMIRRGEYVSHIYSLKWLLSKSMAAGEPFAYINQALVYASNNDWHSGDALIKQLKDSECGEAIRWWKTLSGNSDAEGDLVLGWLIRHSKYDDGAYNENHYFSKALIKFPSLPDWMFN